MNVTVTSNVGSCDFKFYLHYVSTVGQYIIIRHMFRMTSNICCYVQITGLHVYGGKMEITVLNEL